MSSGDDFNYRVALASGLRSLGSGRIGHAEEQFRYLVSKFPHDGGGYRGLAKVQVRLKDHAAALETLRCGAAALARAGERSAAITLLRDAVELAPRDLPAHRRLGAALALAGDHEGAILEYGRFVDAAIAAGDVERASLEARYAHEMLPASRDLTSLRDVAERGADAGAPAPWNGSDAGRGDHAPIAEMAAADVLSVRRRTEQLIASRDPGAAAATVDAARRLLAGDRTSEASELLLDATAAGIGSHGVQVLLAEIAQRTGRRDVARTKYGLLAQKLRLQGEAVLAEELDRLSRTV